MTTISYESPLELAIAAIHFMPSTLSDSLCSAQKPEHLLEDHFQKEFYRSLYYLVDGELLTSPEYVTKRGQNGGAIDFFFPGPKWGIELIRDGNEIDEHMARFEPGGQYHSLLATNEMVDFVVLDFTQKSAKKKCPDMSFVAVHQCIMMSNMKSVFLEHKKFYHVRFSQDFREVQILDSSLETITDFTLSERRNPLFHYWFSYSVEAVFLACPQVGTCSVIVVDTKP